MGRTLCLNVQINNKNALYVFNLPVIFQTHPYFADTGSTPLDVAKNREIIRLLKKAQNEEVESMVKVSSEQY